MRWMDERLPLPRLAYGAVGGGYPVPRNLNYFWNFGVLAGIFLTIQIVSGIVLAMHYYATTGGAFQSVNQLIMSSFNRSPFRASSSSRTLSIMKAGCTTRISTRSTT